MTENTVLDKNVSSIIKFKDEIGNNYPEWKSKRLLDLCDSISDGDWIESKDQSESGIRLIQTGNIGIGIFYDKGDKAKYISEKTFKQLHCKEVICGDILVSRLPDPAGRCCIIPDIINEKMITAVDCTIIRVSKNISSKYILQYMCCEKYFSNVQELLAGGTRQRISRKNLEKISIPTPCLEEQEKIASFLTSIDNLIFAQESNISILETYNRGLISKIFKQEIRFKDANGNEFPDWEEKNLIEVCNFINGKAHENAIEEKGTYIVVNSKFISSDGTVKKYSNAQIVPLYKNDIVMVMSDVPNGKAIAKCYLIDCDNKFTLNQRICALRTNQNPYFIKMQVNRNPYYLKFDDGVKQTNLRKEDVLKCPLQLPCLEEQERIANFLTSLDTVLQEEKNYLEYLKTIKKGLLQQMFV